MKKSAKVAAEIRGLLDYDPATGIFRWRPRPTINHATRTWNIRFAGTVAGFDTNKNYRQIEIYKSGYKAHRLAWLHYYGEWPQLHIDHINGDRLDNRINNLRQATKSQNGGNSKISKKNTTGLKGVSIVKKTGKYHSQIMFCGEIIRLGDFETPEEAHAAYVHAASELFGEFARAS